MKASFLCCLMIAMIIGGCKQEQPSKLEGAWNLVYLKSVAADTVQYKIPGDYTISDFKMWSKDHFSFVGIYKKDTISKNAYGGGTYTLDGNRYTENIIYHVDNTIVGTTAKMIIEIKNDTLYQTWPADANWKIDSSNYRIEKYVKF
jgi:hypothetical protein